MHTLVVELAPDSNDSLRLRSYLSALRPDASFHDARGKRHPLGTYNLSVSRVCERVRRCAEKLEAFWIGGGGSFRTSDHLRDEIVDEIEGCLYAAAEHVDDIARIGDCFFKKDRQFSNVSKTKSLRAEIKILKKRTSSYANVIKHAHGRIRLYRFEFMQEGRNQPLLGFFIEGFSEGKVRPHPDLHGTGETIVSVTSYLWEALLFLWRISEEFCKFLADEALVDDEAIPEISGNWFREAVIALARLPLYSLDESHPFSAVKVSLTGDNSDWRALDSGVYGSIRNNWSQPDQGAIGASELMYAGDGVSRSFMIVQPRQLKIQLWDT